MQPGSIIKKWREKGNPWNGTIFNFHRRKNSKSLSAGKVMITVFWDCEGVILVGAMLRRETINSDTCIRTSTELRKHFK
jgi:hypothetical protein